MATLKPETAVAKQLSLSVPDKTVRKAVERKTDRYLVLGPQIDDSCTVLVRGLEREPAMKFANEFALANPDVPVTVAIESAVICAKTIPASVRIQKN